MNSKRFYAVMITDIFITIQRWYGEGILFLSSLLKWKDMHKLWTLLSVMLSLWHECEIVEILKTTEVICSIYTTTKKWGTCRDSLYLFVLYVFSIYFDHTCSKENAVAVLEEEKNIFLLFYFTIFFFFLNLSSVLYQENAYSVCWVCRRSEKLCASERQQVLVWNVSWSLPLALLPWRDTERKSCWVHQYTDHRNQGVSVAACVCHSPHLVSCWVNVWWRN